MCEPTTILLAATALSAGLGVAQAGMAHKAQNQQAKYAEKVATVERNANIQRIMYEQEQRKDDQADRVEALRRESEAKMATASVAAAEAGVSGNSVDAVLNELSGQAAESSTNLETNYLRSGMGTATELYNTEAQRASTIANNPRASGLATALQIGQVVTGAVASGASTYAKKK